MGLSPPAGSLSAALLAWSSFRWGLGLDGSIIVPDGVIAIQLAIGCFVDGWTRLAPYLAVVDRGEIRQAVITEQKCIGVFVFNPCRSSTGGLGASSSVACFFQKPRQESIQTIGYLVFKEQVRSSSFSLV